MIANSELKLRLKNEIFSLLENEEKRNKMSALSRSLGKPLAGKMIAQKILDLIK